MKNLFEYSLQSPLGDAVMYPRTSMKPVSKKIHPKHP